MNTMTELKALHLNPTRVCMICYESVDVCKLTELQSAYDNDYAYVFEPIYSNILEFPDLEIDGINLDLRLSQYIRINRLPSFLYKRFIPINREDWQEVYKRVGVPESIGQDQWEFMLYSNGAINEDTFRVRRL